MGDSKNQDAIVVIPARHDSSRFPEKPLAEIAGRSMIARVYERAKKAERIARVIVATDDERILSAVKDFGGEVLMTRRDHSSGTDRIAEVAAHIPAAIYVNVQGDEPLIDPAAIDAIVAAMQEDDSIQIATPSTIIKVTNEIMDPNVVKVVTDFDGNALYFSRAPIPWVRDRDAPVHAQHMKHLGLYAFRRAALLDFPTLPLGDLERIEQLEQLRWMENGYKIRVAETQHDSISVDVQEDVARVEKLLSKSRSA
jgi:3-deoxy-manno-octulosonate cytidylyltransferase (CMP-KDO synthetase)